MKCIIAATTTTIVIIIIIIIIIDLNKFATQWIKYVCMVLI